MDGLIEYVTLEADAAPAAPVQRLAALLLLGGTIRRTPWRDGTGRPVFDLPLRRDWSILDHWQEEARALAALRDDEALPVRVAVDRSSRPLPRRDADIADVLAPISIERDRQAFRGAGGVVRDLAMDHADNDWLLVATAAQVLNRPLHTLASALAATGGDLAAIVHRDGTPSGVFLIRCGAVRDLPKVGFVDLKEQALLALAQRHRVTALELNRPSAQPICTLADYLAAVRRQAAPAGTDPDDPYAEPRHPGFAVVEEGARVDPTAILHDSVILRGGCVEAGATVVRSLVCPGGVVARGQALVDQCITAARAVTERGRR